MEAKGFQSASGWVENKTLGVKVHSETGRILNLINNQPLTTFRNKKTGRILCYLPYNLGLPGLGQGRLQPIGKVILLTVLGAPEEYLKLSPRKVMVIPINGNKWDIRPINLTWIDIQTYMQNLVMYNKLGIKLTPNLAHTARKVVGRIEQENEVDFDAVGSVFRICADQLVKIHRDKHWSFLDRFNVRESEPLICVKKNEAEEASRAYGEADRKLVTLMAGGE